MHSCCTVLRWIALAVFFGLVVGSEGTSLAEEDARKVDRTLDRLIDHLEGGIRTPGYREIMAEFRSLDRHAVRERLRFIAEREGVYGNSRLVTASSVKTLWAAMTGTKRPRRRCDTLGLHFHMWHGVPLPFGGCEPPSAEIWAADAWRSASERDRVLPWPNRVGESLLRGVLSDDSDMEKPLPRVVGALIGEAAKQDEALGRALLDAVASLSLGNRARSSEEGGSSFWVRATLIHALGRWGAGPAVARLGRGLYELGRRDSHLSKILAARLRELDREDILHEFREHLVSSGEKKLLETFDRTVGDALHVRSLLAALKEGDDRSVVPELVRTFNDRATAGLIWDIWVAGLRAGIRMARDGTEDDWREGENLVQAVLWSGNRGPGISTTIRGTHHSAEGDEEWEIPLRGARLGGYPDPVGQAEEFLRLIDAGELLPAAECGVPMNFISRRMLWLHQWRGIIDMKGVSLHAVLDGEAIRLTIHNGRKSRIHVNTLPFRFSAATTGGDLVLHVGTVVIPAGQVMMSDRRHYVAIEPGKSYEVRIAAGPLVHRVSAVDIIWGESMFPCARPLKGDHLERLRQRLDLKGSSGAKDRK